MSEQLDPDNWRCAHCGKPEAFNVLCPECELAAVRGVLRADERHMAEATQRAQAMRKLLKWYESREEYLGSFDYDDWMRNNPKPEGGA